MRSTVGGSFVVGLALAALVGCGAQGPTSPEGSPESLAQPNLKPTVQGVTESTPQAASVALLGKLNRQLAGSRAACRVAMMEFITAPTSGQFGCTVFAKDVGNKQLPYHWAAEEMLDPGRFTYAVDETEGAATGGLTSTETEGAIDRAMRTWDQIPGSRLALTKTSEPGTDLGFVQNLLQRGGMPGWVADVTHAGWLPGEFFDLLEPDGSDYILGVTFTFVWVDNVTGEPLDTNRDHRIDVAFREIYYNNAFTWTNEPVDFTSLEIDVESIALHEAGHGLSQAHFGYIFLDGKGTRQPQLAHLHFAPRAVMNAVYWDTQRQLLPTDVAGHLSIWTSWPN